MQFLEGFDQGAVHPFRHVLQIQALHPVLIGLSWLGHPLFLTGVCLVAAAAFLRRKETRTALLLLLTLAAALGLGFLGSVVVARDRPNESGSPLPIPTTGSFPSVHALGAAALYGALGVLLARRVKRRWPLLVGLLLALLAGAGQLMIRHNFLTDVFAGWVAGGALATLCVQLDAPAGPEASAPSGASP
jgi:undecaprenyl-diphosphatase